MLSAEKLLELLKRVLKGAIYVFIAYLAWVYDHDGAQVAGRRFIIVFLIVLSGGSLIAALVAGIKWFRSLFNRTQ